MGMACRVVEHNEATGEPAIGGLVVAAVVVSAFGPVVEVRAEGEYSRCFSRPLTFYADGSFMAGPQWRLLAGTGDASG